MSTTPSQDRERRSSERVLIRIPVKVYGVRTNGRHVNEAAHAIVVSRFGALLRVSSQLDPEITVDVLNGFSQEVEKFRVVWVSELPKEDQYDVGIEIVNPRDDFWGIRFPPERK